VTSGITAVVLLLILAMAGVWWQVGRSLAIRSGDLAVTGLSDDVRVEFDAAGIPSIHAASHADAARALGFVHAQERFFQMDLARRSAAGELAELFGPAAVAADRAVRLHRFRYRAARVLAEETAEARALLTAYADGVNAGLAALSARPFEYYLIGQDPRPWTPADSILVGAAMFFDLQDEDAVGDVNAGALYDALPAPLAAFLDSNVSDWDTPQQGAALPPLQPPGPDVFNLRTTAPSPPAPAEIADLDDDLELSVGSNNWAVAGTRTRDGRAILANDPHLALRVPNIWYRASVSWRQDESNVTVVGVSIAGLPGIIIGSNGHLAWGFTNSNGDWSDRVLLTVDEAGRRYLTPNGWQPFQTTAETIVVAGAAPVSLDIRETIWGPVTGPDAQGRLQAIEWVAHHPEGLNLRFIAMETATTLDEAITIANLSGTPAQNCLLADAHGHIAWTIAGRMPRRVGFDGTVPVSWADGTRGWNGWYAPADYPRVVDPPSGVIVTANNRIVSGDWLAMFGHANFDTGARARQIQDALLARDTIGYEDILRVQLDDRAILMAQWRDLALDVLRTAPETEARRQFRDLVEQGWTGHASVDSVGYRLVRAFRQQAAALAWAPFVERARKFSAEFPAVPGRSYEGPVWTMLTEKPTHLLDPAFADWNALMADAVDRAIENLTAGDRPLADRTWGEFNTLRAQHPISRAVPWLSRWLDLPAMPLPGDNDMPRVQTPTNGASMRLAISPGDELAGYFEQPGGQSGNPRSPNFQDGFDAWATGNVTPFVPGAPVSTLTLRAGR
jgi:penicillin amidase